MGKTIGRTVISMLLLLSPAYSEENFVDLLHREISHMVYSTVERVDHFFADQRTKEESRSYIRLRTGFRYTGKPEYNNILSFDFKFRLRKLEKKVNIMLKQKEKDRIQTGRKKIPILKQRVSIGISGLPKIYGKYEIFTLPVIYKRWEIRLFQRFKIIHKVYDYRLEERTQIYIDRLIAPETVWRVFLERYNASDLHFQRLNYFFFIRKYSLLKKGRTATDLIGGITQDRIINGGVSRYTLQHRIRANIWRRWTFFNIHVGSDWYKNRGFKATPFIMVYLEFYAGKF